MSHYRSRTIAGRLETTRIATHNALATPAVLTALGEHTYNATKIAAGQALHESAGTAVSTATARFGAQKAATAQVVAKRRETRAAFQRFAKLARTHFQDDPGALGILGLDVPMPRTDSAFVVAATNLWDGSRYTAAMKADAAELGYTEERLAEEQAKVDGLVATLQTYYQQKAAYQAAKLSQRTAVKAMDKWMGRFLRIARVALADQPQAVEQLGVVARTFPTQAQRDGRRKAAATRLQKKAQRQMVNLPKAA